MVTGINIIIVVVRRSAGTIRTGLHNDGAEGNERWWSESKNRPIPDLVTMESTSKKNSHILILFRNGCNNLRIADVNWALQTTFQMTTAPKEGTATSLEHPAASDITITNTPYFAKCPTRPIYPDPTYNHHLHIHLTHGAFLREIPLPTHCGNLILEGHNPADFIITCPYDRETFVRFHLHLINCPGFTDSELKLPFKIDPVTKWPSFSFDLIWGI